MVKTLTEDDKKWLVTVIEAFMFTVPGEDDRAWSSEDMATFLIKECL